MEKITAQTTDASIKVEAAQQAHLSNRCFLCSNEIGESAPRRFYQGKNAMLLGHTGCVDRFETDQRRAAEEARLHPGVRTDPVASTPSQEPVVTASPPSPGPAHLRFDTFDALQNWIYQHGPIPDGCSVSLSEMLLRPGQS